MPRVEIFAHESEYSKTIGMTPIYVLDEHFTPVIRIWLLNKP